MASDCEPGNVFVPKSAILDGKFFTVVHEKDGKLKARCELCKPGKETIISGSCSATTNFKTHLKVSEMKIIFISIKLFS